MSRVYIPKVNPNEKRLHIRALMHQRLAHLMKTGMLKFGNSGSKVAKPPKLTLKAIKFKKGK